MTFSSLYISETQQRLKKQREKKEDKKTGSGNSMHRCQADLDRHTAAAAASMLAMYCAAAILQGLAGWSYGL